MAETMVDEAAFEVAREQLVGAASLSIAYEDELIEHECGVVAVYDPSAKNIGRLTVRMMVDVQHRGKTSNGAAVYGDDRAVITGAGKVHEVFPDVRDESEPNMLDEKAPNARTGIGQVRWATSGGPEWAHPFVGKDNDYALGANGEITNIEPLVREYGIEPEKEESDTSLANKMLDIEITRHDGDVVKGMKALMEKLEGGFVFVLNTPTQVIVARDPWGTRTVSMARYMDGSVRFASETMPFDRTVDGEEQAYTIEEVQRGKIVIVDEKGITELDIEREAPKRLCPFETIYFQSPEHRDNGRTVESMREDMGERLGKKFRGQIDEINTQVPEKQQIKPDGVIAAPNSAIPASRGFSKGSGIPFIENALRKINNERSYTEDSIEKRNLVLDANLVMDKGFAEWVEGKSIVIGDDSIVAGLTMKRLVKWLYGVGAKEVHVVVFSPEIKSGCYMGANIRSDSPGLVAEGRDVREIAGIIGPNSVTYLDFEDMAAGMDKEPDELCDCCFTGVYHIDIPERHRKSEPEAVRVGVQIGWPRSQDTVPKSNLAI